MVQFTGDRFTSMTSAGRRRFRMVNPVYPAFNIYSRIADVTTALGPLCVATEVSRLPGWDVEVIDENNYRRFGPKTPARLPDHATLQTIRRADVVGLYGGLSSTIVRLYDVARFYRSQGVTTIAGGQHFFGENIRTALENGIDYVVLGEGERTIVELLEAIERGDGFDAVDGIAFLRGGEVVQTPPREPITDFDSLSIPDFELLRYSRIKIYPVSWVRGCGMNCEFCTVKGRPRASSTERVVEQIASVLEGRGGRKFFIVDDLFGQNRREALRLCRMLETYQKAIGTKIEITVQIRLDRGRDAELLAAMRAAGVVTVAIGFESPIGEELEAMNKKIRPAEMVDLTRRFHEAGFLVHGMFIFGYPMADGVTFSMSAKERVRRFRSFIKKARLDTVQVLLPVPLPGTELTERLVRENRVLPVEHVGWEYYDGNFPLIEPDPPLSPADLHASMRKIMGRFYRFRSMFAIARNVVLFPAMVFSIFDPRYGWRKWRRFWRNDIVRFGGWILLRRWTAQLKQGKFREKLADARSAARSKAGEEVGAVR